MNMRACQDTVKYYTDGSNIIATISMFPENMKPMHADSLVL